MEVLSFTDILRKVGLDPARVKLIRHPLSHQRFRDCYMKGKVLEYTKQQKSGFGKGYDYWCVFIGEKSTLAKFYACYKVNGAVPDTRDVAPADFPYPEWFEGKGLYFDLMYTDHLKAYEDRLVIDWGPSARMWHQKGTSEKPIVSIQADNKKYFTGFENLILTYDELKAIVDEPTIYGTWYDTLSAVNAVYLIVDLASGKQYVGSAYGKDGLWGRWSTYVATHHAGNKKMVELLQGDPERYHQFQFSVLQILPKTAISEEVINIENLYKKKLKTIDFGLNDN